MAFNDRARRKRGRQKQATLAPDLLVCWGALSKDFQVRQNRKGSPGNGGPEVAIQTLRGRK